MAPTGTPQQQQKLPAELTRPPPSADGALVAFPRPHVLLVTLDRPRALNAITRDLHFALDRLWDWYEEEPWLRCAVLTGGGGRAFCAGADLKEWHDQHHHHHSHHHQSRQKNQAPSERQPGSQAWPANPRLPRGGFGGISNRPGKKPVVAAVAGLCLGGGLEMVANCDMVVASASARFALPEVSIGVVAVAGALPRLAASVGRQRASEMALTARRYSAEELRAWGLVSEVVVAGSGSRGGGAEGEAEAAAAAVVEAALDRASQVAANSPDAVIVSREGLKAGWGPSPPDAATDALASAWYQRIDRGENMVEGIASFNEKRKPVWKDSKL